MSYSYGGLTLANVGDVVTQSSVSTNFELVLKNSASGTAPTDPQTGQLWYDTSAGVLKINTGTPASPVWQAGGNVTTSGTQTLTNKRIDPRVFSSASAASITPDIGSYDQFCFTAQAAALTVNAPSGTPVDGNKIIFRFIDNGTSRAITWNATYVPIGVTLPTATTVNKMTYVGCIYNAANTRWDVVAVTTQA